MHGKVLLVHDDYTLCLNKSKGDKSYFRCSHKTPTQCHATAIIKGDLEEGNFEVLMHGVDKHSHDKFPVMFLIKKKKIFFEVCRTCTLMPDQGYQTSGTVTL